MTILNLIKLLSSSCSEDHEIAKTAFHNNPDLKDKLAIILCYIGLFNVDSEELEQISTKYHFKKGLLIKLWYKYARGEFFSREMSVEELTKIFDNETRLTKNS